MTENSTVISSPKAPKLNASKWIIGLAVVILLCCSSILAVDYYQTSQLEIFILPEGFVGPVLIIYDQPDGVPARYEKDIQVFEIPASGLLLTQAPMPEGIGDDFWYRNEL
ncbi:MAG: hypothetical protein L0Y56_15655, partial [Nitrospira sp.]|nr:hypothetical protein [Nitrospira sp.]